MIEKRPYLPLPTGIGRLVRRIRACEGAAAAQLLFERALFDYVDADRAALASQPQAHWISVDDQLPEPSVEVLCAGKDGCSAPFVSACYYDDERHEWYPVNTHWTDATGRAEYPTDWMAFPPPPGAAETASQPQAAPTEYVIELLMAAGHVTREKVDEARAIASGFCQTCGKRLGSAPHIHTCTPPAGGVS